MVQKTATLIFRSKITHDELINVVYIYIFLLRSTFVFQKIRKWSIPVNIWKTIHTTWVWIPGSGLNFFFGNYFSCMQNYDYQSDLHIYSSCFISFYLSIFQITFLSFFFLKHRLFYISWLSARTFFLIWFRRLNPV